MRVKYERLDQLENNFDLNSKTDKQLLNIQLKITKILNDRGVNISEDNKSFEAQVCEALYRIKL
ncbi:hypothetical protein [Poseidonibacter sp.]|uniref:hypothetical protein n=1 Tax=Poseidonibacter sp. TaxID=2321188 RepID=UPI003C768C64